MRKKIIYGIFLSVLLLISMTISATAIPTTITSANFASNSISNTKKISSYVDPPVWEKGDGWTYDLNDVEINIEQGYGIVFHLQIGTANIPVEVTNAVGDSYDVSFDTRISGNIYVEANMSGLSIKVEGNLVRMKLTGEITYHKSDLGITKLSLQLSGKLALSISKPIRLPAIKALVTLKLNMDLSNPYPFLSFPLEPDNMWGLPATGITLDGSLKSPWLRVVNIIHNIIRLTGMIPGEYQEYSDLIKQILPVIDISDTLTLFEISNPIDIKEHPVLFYCLNTESVTVPAGIFDAYNITILDIASMYYAPDVGRIIKITGNLKDLIPFLENINIELIKIGAIKS